MTTHPDPRTHAIRDDLADSRLKASVDRPNYAAPTRRQVIFGRADLLTRPDPQSPRGSELLFGEEVNTFGDADANGFFWCQSVDDRYVGYVRSASLSENIFTPTHRVCIPHAPVFEANDIKSPCRSRLTLEARVRCAEHAQSDSRNAPTGKLIAIEELGFVLDRHLWPLRETHGFVRSDPVDVAEQLIHAPYIWGGRSVLGIDCSALVQLSFRTCGQRVARDSDMQEQTIGRNIPLDTLTRLQRGDLIFWPGHVALGRGDGTLIHANAHHLSVAIETVECAVDRIKSSGLVPSAICRPNWQ